MAEDDGYIFVRRYYFFTVDGHLCFVSEDMDDHWPLTLSSEEILAKVAEKYGQGNYQSFLSHPSIPEPIMVPSGGFGVIDGVRKKDVANG